MKNLFLFAILFGLFTLPSCTGVDAGHRGVKVSWGGDPDMNRVYEEGLHTGLHWIWDDMIQYDIREHTLTKKFEFNDKNNMVTPVEVSLDYYINPKEVHLLHTTITDHLVKIENSLKSASKEVIPQYSAVELNIKFRNEAEDKLGLIVKEELPEFHIVFARLRITDVDIPPAVAQLATETAVQLGKNELASKLQAEKEAKAQALIAEAKGNYEAALFDAKTKDIMSSPKMLDLKRVENEALMWQGFLKHGKSPFGDNNMYGVTPAIVRGLGK